MIRRLFKHLAATIALASLPFLLLGQSQVKQVGPDYLGFSSNTFFGDNGRIFLSSSGGLYFSDEGQPWRKVNESFNNLYFNTVNFLKSTDGKIYAWNRSQIHFSTDNGDSWNEWFIFFLPVPFTPINSVALQGDTLFVALKGGLGYVVDQSSLVEPFAKFNNMNILRVEVEGNSILAFGSDSKTYLSTNRGQTWVDHTQMPFAIEAESLQKLDRKGKVLVAANNTSVWISEDFGGSWFRKSGGLPTNTQFFFNNIRINGDEVFVGGSPGAWKSSLTVVGEWLPFYMPSPAASVYSISIQDNNAILGGFNQLVGTYDRGLNWAPLSIKGIHNASVRQFHTANADGSILAYGGTAMFKKKVSDVQFLPFINVSGQALIEGNLIYKGGVTVYTYSAIDGKFIKYLSQGVPNANTVSSADEVLHVNDEFFSTMPTTLGIWKLTSQNTWLDFNAGLPSPDVRSLHSDGKFIYGICDRALYRSELITPMWEKVLDVASSDLVNAYLIQDSIIVAGTGGSGDCYISRDSGDTWNQIGESVLEGGINAFHFDSDQLLVATYASLYTTKDLGETWREVPLVDSLKYSLFLQAIATTADSVYLGTTGNGILSFSKDLLDKTNQSITFNSVQSKTIGDAPFVLNANASSNLPVTYTTSSDKISVAGNQVSLIKPGSVTITAGQAGDDNFHPAPSVSQTFCVNPAKPVVTMAGGNSENIILISNSESGNQWYKNGTSISGATSKQINVSEVGVYTVRVTIDNCPSVFSDEQPLVVTGDINPIVLSPLLLYPNPATHSLTLNLADFDSNAVVEILVYNSTGSPREKTLVYSGKATIAVGGYPSGLFLIKAKQQRKLAFGRFLKE